jgi:predicted transposase YdaD
MINKTVVREFFEVHLPENIKNILDFSSIEPQKDSFINDKLRLKIADLLYEAQFNGETEFVYLLLDNLFTFYGSAS